MHASPEDIARAITLLRSGRLVAFPTETVYGLGADALDAAAVEKVFGAKGRPPTNPLIVHVVDEAMARRVCGEWTGAASRLVEAFWPGPLTLVLPKSSDVPDVVTAGGDTVAVRCPSHPLTLALLETFGSPLVGPSANRSGHVSPTCAAHVRDSFAADEVFVLDGGPCTGGIESTVLDLTTDPPRVLRPGLISAEEIGEVLGSVIDGSVFAASDPDAPARSPGLMQSHYAPTASTQLIELGSLQDAIGACRSDGFIAVVGAESVDVADPNRLVTTPTEPAAYAARLYAALREADALAPARILVIKPWPGAEPTGLWRAIADRLCRATGPRSGDRGRD